MGIYRLILAILVAMSHVGVTFWGYNPGVAAVVSFFLLSGYVMTMLIGKYYDRPAAVPAFYLDRAARLFPQFLFYMVLATLCIHFLHLESPSFLSQLDGVKLLLNFLILPQGFYMYWADGALVLPQTWSLGLELTFYLAIPWILIKWPRRGVYLLSAASLVVYCCAYSGLINSDHFGYRLLPGTLFMFLFGASLNRDTAGARRYRGAVYAVLALLYAGLFFSPRLYGLNFNKEVLAGLLIGIPVVMAIRSRPYSRIDEFLGNLSYGVFLNHFLLIWVIQKVTGQTVEQTSVPLLLAASMLLALLSYLLIERPALRWRHGIRQGKAAPVLA